MLTDRTIHPLFSTLMGVEYFSDCELSVCKSQKYLLYKAEATFPLEEELDLNSK